MSAHTKKISLNCSGSLDPKYTQSLDWFFSSSFYTAGASLKTYYGDRVVHHLETGQRGFQDHTPGDKHVLFFADESSISRRWATGVFRDLNEFKQRHNLSISDFLFVANACDPKNAHVAQSMGIPKENIILIDYYVLQTYCFHRLFNAEHNCTYVSNAPKDCRMLIGKPKLHRLVFMHELWQEGLLNNSVTSILIDPGDADEIAEQVANCYQNLGMSCSSVQSIADMLHTLGGSPDNVNYYYWKDQHGPNNHCPGYPYDCNTFANTGFSVIPETHYFSQDSSLCFVTEKTYKAIYNHHPFVIFGSSGMLEGLHNKGYKTFGTIINEDYDNKDTDQARIKKSIDAVKQMQHTQSHDALSSIVNHNYQTLISNAQNTIDTLNSAITKATQ